jgi:hypothetical protein
MCCSECISSNVASCEIRENNRYKTFDGDRMLQTILRCMYLVAKVRVHNTSRVSVYLKNSPEYVNKKKMQIYVDCAKITIGYNGDITVRNGDHLVYVRTIESLYRETYTITVTTYHVRQQSYVFFVCLFSFKMYIYYKFYRELLSNGHE